MALTDMPDDGLQKFADYIYSRNLSGCRMWLSTRYVGWSPDLNPVTNNGCKSHRGHL